MGIELTRRLHSIPVFGLTMPLLLTSDGKKMGKSESGAIWLDSSKTSVFDFWQFWRNINDPDVGKMLRLLTDIPMDETRRLESLKGQEINDAKIILADFITSLVHGQIALKQAKEQAKGIFENANKFPEILLDNQISIIDFLVKFGGITSKSQAKRDIEQGGVKIDGRSTDIGVVINKDCLVSIGKKKFFKVILEIQ